MYEELKGIDTRIKISELEEEVKLDPINGFVYYLNKSRGQKWRKDRAYAGCHGGGSPRLTVIDQFPWEEE